MQIKNFTPHVLNLHVPAFQDRPARVLDVPPYMPKGEEARVSIVARPAGFAAAEVPLVAHTYGEVTGCKNLIVNRPA